MRNNILNLREFVNFSSKNGVGITQIKPPALLATLNYVIGGLKWGGVQIKQNVLSITTLNYVLPELME